MSSTPYPYEGIREFVAQLPEFVQPIVVAGAGMIPYVEGEGSAALGILVGIHPIVAAVAGATGNFLSVLLVVLLSSRVRESVVARRAARATTMEGGTTTLVDDGPGAGGGEKPTRRAKGQKRLRTWMTRFGVPGASILAPLALPTQLTAAFFVGAGVKRSWVLLWQAIAIVLWTGLVAAAALGLVNLLGWA